MAWQGMQASKAWRQNMLQCLQQLHLGLATDEQCRQTLPQETFQAAATHLSMVLKRDPHLCLAHRHFLQVVTGQPRPGLTLLERIQYCRNVASELGLCCSAQEKAPQSSSCIPAQPQTTIGSAYAQRVVTVSWSGRMVPGNKEVLS